MANFTAITVGAAANAATVNNPLGELDAAIGTLALLTTTDKTDLVSAVNEVIEKVITFGADITQPTLRAWTEGESYELINLVYDTTYTNTLSAATVAWPDGSTGDFAATTINATYEAIDAYTITHDASGLTVTQPAVTRNTDGAVTTKPPLGIT